MSEAKEILNSLQQLDYQSARQSMTVADSMISADVEQVGVAIAPADNLISTRVPNTMAVEWIVAGYVQPHVDDVEANRRFQLILPVHIERESYLMYRGQTIPVVENKPFIFSIRRPHAVSSRMMNSTEIKKVHQRVGTRGFSGHRSIWDKEIIKPRKTEHIAFWSLGILMTKIPEDLSHLRVENMELTGG